jgi:hypothetical protein
VWRYLTGTARVAARAAAKLMQRIVAVLHVGQCAQCCMPCGCTPNVFDWHAGTAERQAGQGQLLESMSDIEPLLLQQSDFALPPDDQTRDMYRRLLDGL